jgi:hypothetical protein
MKTRTKITALAVFAALAGIAALAVFSCAPEAELSGVNWKDINSGYNSGKNSDYTAKMNAIISGFSVTGRLATGANEANEVTITFPVTSDFLRTANDSKIASGMKQFLSFHHFKKNEIPEAGKADTLDTAQLAYNFVRRNDNIVTVALTKTFTETDSNVIMKIDGTKYTFASGNKLDLVGRGKSGEKGYDDLYFQLPVSNVIDSSEFFGPMWTGTAPNRRGLGFNRGWHLTLNAISVPEPSAGETIEAKEYKIAWLNLAGLNGTSEEKSDIIKTIAEGLKSGLKIQEFTNGKWNLVSASVDFLVDEEPDKTAAIFNVYITSPKDLVPVRVMWDRSAPVTTSAEYFGVKQLIAIRGANTSPNANTYSTYQTAKVYGDVGYWYDTEKRSFDAERYISDITILQDNRYQNVVFEVVFWSVISEYDPEDISWLKSFNNNKQGFKDNFKVAYYEGGGGVADDFTSRLDVRYITIKDVEYFNHNPGKDEDIGTNINAIRITLDPAYALGGVDENGVEEAGDELYFYISPEIGFTDNKTTFGDPDNFMYGFFKAYKPEPSEGRPGGGEGGGGDGYTGTYPRLPEGVWTIGTIALGNLNFYYFPVTEQATYRVWWDDSYQGGTNKTQDVYVSAQYEGATTWNIFDSYDSGWTTERTFTANQTGFVIIRVHPWASSTTPSGTYGITYTVNNATRPPIN